MLHPDELEEMEYQLHADADYLSEAFGEALLLAKQEHASYLAELEYEDELAAREAGVSLKEYREVRDAECRKEVEAYKAKQRAYEAANPCPF